MADSALYMILLLQIILTAFIPHSARAIKMLRVSVPHYAHQGETVTLHCQYDLLNDQLYSVSWYKDHEEFYRYVPKSRPPQTSYRVEGVIVLQNQSDSQKVVLRKVDLRSSGKYKCEVSAEKPSFSSVHGEGELEVVFLPREDPEITGGENIYQVGDVINLNCTSGKSYPPARLRWFINDLQVVPDSETVVQQHGLTTTVVGLRLEVRPHHFLDGRMQVRCVSTISAGRESLVHQRTAPLIDNREASLLVEGSGSRGRACWYLILVLWAFTLLTT